MRIVAVACMMMLALLSCAQPTGTPAERVTMRDQPVEDSDKKSDPEPEPTEPEPVPDANRAPTVTLSDSSAIVGEVSTLTADGDDPDGDDLVYEWSGAVESLGNPAEWTPAAEGEYEATVTVTDGEYEASATATITVSPAPWAPKDGWIYMLDVNGDIYLSEQPAPEDWYTRLNAYEYGAETYNMQEKDGYPFNVVASEPPEGA